MEGIATMMATARTRGLTGRIVTAAVALLIILPLLLAAAGCGAGESPSEVAEQALRAIAAKDCDRILDLTATDKIDQVYEGDRDKALEDCRASMDQTNNIEGVGDVSFEITEFEVLEEQIDGDNATVKYRAVVRTTAEGIDEEQTDEDQIELTKEGSSWKVAGLGA